MKTRLFATLVVLGATACHGERLPVGQHTETRGGSTSSARGGSAGASDVASGGTTANEAGASSGVNAQGGTTQRMSGGAGGTVFAPVPDYCGELKLEYDAGSCSDDEECPRLSCECESSDSKGVRVCTEDRGCLVALDCPAYCALDSGYAIPQLCALEPCNKDSDCEYLCVRAGTAQEAGFCDSGRFCAEQSDCDAGSRCLVTRSHGTRECWSGTDFSYCNTAQDCGVGQCAVEDGRLVGLCTDGTLDSLCWHDEDCVDDMRCFLWTAEQSAGHCSDGSDRAWCDLDEDCQSGMCVDRPGTDHRECSSGKLLQACDTDTECESGLCAKICTDGALKSPCWDDGDCIGLSCAKNQCSDRSVGSPCDDESDCDSEICGRGVCTDGSSGSPCDSVRDCQSRWCDYDEEDNERYCR